MTKKRPKKDLSEEDAIVQIANRLGKTILQEADARNQLKADLYHSKIETALSVLFTLIVISMLL